MTEVERLVQENALLKRALTLQEKELGLLRGFVFGCVFWQVLLWLIDLIMMVRRR